MRRGRASHRAPRAGYPVLIPPERRSGSTPRGERGQRFSSEIRNILHRMKKHLAVVGFALAVASVTLVAQTKVLSPTKPRGAVAAQTQRSEYFPERFDRQHRKPEDVGMRSAQIDEAVKAAVAAETRGPKDMVQFLTNSFGKE